VRATLLHKGFEHHTPWSIASITVLTNPNWRSKPKAVNKANQKQTFNMKFFAAVAALSLGGVEGKKKK
jgi:hypothetical protein